MTSKPVSALLVDLGVTRSHSRPRVSNDNPFSEAQFKTMKYLYDFPKSFATGPTPPKIPEQSWINQPQPELQNT